MRDHYVTRAYVPLNLCVCVGMPLQTLQHVSGFFTGLTIHGPEPQGHVMHVPSIN